MGSAVVTRIDPDLTVAHATKEASRIVDEGNAAGACTRAHVRLHLLPLELESAQGHHHAW